MAIRVHSTPARGSGVAVEPIDDPAVPQHGLPFLGAVWLAATVPMAVLSWIVAPWLATMMAGPAPLVSALLVSLTAGMVWQCVLVLLLVRREQDGLSWPVLRRALWLRSPRSPRTGRVGGRTWLVLVPLIVLFGAEQLLPSLPLPPGRDFTAFLDSGTGRAFFDGSWGWFGLFVVMGIFNTVLGEELLFRGYLLPRMRGAFGRADWLVNGILFAAYHLHTPWVIPATLVDTFALALPARRYRSAWLPIAVHSTQTVFLSLALLTVVR